MPSLVAKASGNGSALLSSVRLPLSMPIERWIEAEIQSILERLALIELPEAGPQGCLAIPFHVPGHAESRLEMIQGLGQRPIGPVRSAEQPGILAGSGARRHQHAVTRVGAKRRVERRWVEARDGVPEIERVLEARPSQAVIQRHARADLPRVGGVRLDVPPSLLNRPFGFGFGEAEGHVFEKQVGEHVAGRVSLASQARCIPEHWRLGRPLVEHILVLLVEAEDNAGLEEVLAKDGRVVVLQDEEVLIVLERRHVLESRRRSSPPMLKIGWPRFAPYSLTESGKIPGMAALS